jgi:hypothetical protein
MVDRAFRQRIPASFADFHHPSSSASMRSHRLHAV